MNHPQKKRQEVRQRATVIRLLHLGYKPEEVAEQQMVSVPTNDIQLA